MAQFQTSMSPWGLPPEQNKSEMPQDLGALIANYRAQGSGDASEGAQMATPSVGNQAPAALTNTAPEADSKELAKNKAELGKAGILAASTLLGKLMEAKAMREKMMRERKAESEKTVAKSTQEAFQQQQAGTINPLSQLVGAYRSAM